MRLIIPAKYMMIPVASSRLAGIIPRIRKSCGDDADQLIRQIRLQEKSADLSSIRVGGYVMCQEIRGTRPWCELFQRTIVRPAEILEVADQEAALAYCRGKSSFGTIQRPGGQFMIDGTEYDVVKHISCDFEAYLVE